MKGLSTFFGVGVIGVAVCLVMSIVTAVQENHKQTTSVTHTLPAPAIGQ